MKLLPFAETMRNYKKENLAKDITAGIIIAAVSIPISMGYAQIAGLPAVYGLYGSVFPILLFALFSTSPQFIFGVDAAPAALVGAALVEMGIEGGSEEAMVVVPMITLLVALWLFIFHFLKAGKLVNYISAPVMGGFITGICTTIILMQVPKLMGGSAGVGELPELLEHLLHTVSDINLPSLILGLAALAILLVSKRLMPGFPMAVGMMAAGAVMSLLLPLKEWGIQTLSAVETGLPAWRLPFLTSGGAGLSGWRIISIDGVELSNLVMLSLSVAVVIMAETLLAENNFAQKNHYRIDDNQEILAFAMGNLVAALTGCCPINGSVSRTAMGEQYQVKTQLTSIVAGISMMGVLLLATGFIGYLPVPVLTAIVISALMGATEFHLAHRLWHVSKKEFFIFVGAFVGVLMLGTINGVLIGIILSFTEMILRSSKPVCSFLGIQPGHRHFRDLKESDDIYPIEGVVIYRFSNSLFFGNASVLRADIEGAIGPDTKAVILDAGGIGSIDITGADCLESIYKSLKTQGIRFYMTEHMADLNEQLRNLDLGYLIEEGVCRRTIHIALKDMGIKRPYPLTGVDNSEELSRIRRKVDNQFQEFAWAFGSEAEKLLEKRIQLSLEQLQKTGDLEELMQGGWHYLDEMDEDEWLEHLEEHMKEIARISGKDEQTLADTLEQHRQDVLERLEREHPELAERFRERRHHMDQHMNHRHPEVYRLILERREKRRQGF